MRKPYPILPSMRKLWKVLKSWRLIEALTFVAIIFATLKSYFDGQWLDSTPFWVVAIYARIRIQNGDE